ncbi:hypothetical protein IKW73_03085 [Candidatus Saccharibacteria bacterium]|nr:hypothetical protein [Candidatus Saccharibacteria bacterium]
MAVKRNKLIFEQFPKAAFHNFKMNAVYVGSVENSLGPYESRIIQDLYAIMNGVITAAHATVFDFRKDKVALNVCAEILLGEEKSTLEVEYAVEDDRGSENLLEAMLEDDGYFFKGSGDVLGERDAKPLKLTIKAKYAEIDDFDEFAPAHRTEVYNDFSEKIENVVSFFPVYFYDVVYSEFCDEDCDEDCDEKEGTEDEA